MVPGVLPTHEWIKRNRLYHGVEPRMARLSPVSRRRSPDGTSIGTHGAVAELSAFMLGGNQRGILNVKA